ncbi:MAG TPA: NAD(P)-binding domain-containing protein [Blastocatellia bacterium]|nr:NAD(P)-binding domain-containing protein [Blastocatellia bacterium]
MKRSQLIITAIFLALLLTAAFVMRDPISYGAVPWLGWVGLTFFTIFVGLTLVIRDTKRSRGHVIEAMAEAEMKVEPAKPAKKVDSPSTLLDPKGPSYPHPVINTTTCIGCHACVDACPHDVLAMVNGKALTVAVEQCMEDTSCEVECPTVPKSCFVVKTTKKIPKRKVPKRDNKFMTNVEGIYLIGDVSGVPLIKNAINEGGSVIDFICEDLKQKGKGGNAEYDVAIIGMGPAGLSAATVAKQRNLRYVALEQDQIAATIQQTYQNGKYVFFNPTDQAVKGGIKLDGAGAIKESMIGSWMNTLDSNGVVINENEGCKDIKREGDTFLVTTDQDKTKQKMQYRSRTIVLAIGNRGTPMRLNVPGEELKTLVTPQGLFFSAECEKCGAKRVGYNKFCQECGDKFVARPRPPYEDEKVKYKLGDPNDYKGQHIIIVGAGNSAIEAAVDLAAYRSEDGTQLTGWRDNFVSLVIRSNFKSDLKLGNKMLVYECIDEGKIKAYFGQTIKAVTPSEVLLMNARERDPITAEETARIRTDYVFALIGGEKPTKFLESIGLKIG